MAKSEIEQIKKRLDWLQSQLEGETVRHNEMINWLSSRIDKIVEEIKSKDMQTRLG